MSGPLPDVLAPLTVPVSWVYERFIEARNRRYDRGVGVEKLPVPVISIGNITTGGTGKTPIVMWIAKFLRAQGYRPAIALRGYGATGRHPADEALEYVERLPDIPLIVHPDRLGASHQHLESNTDTDCIILDDGFQHRRIFRNLDIVLIDAAADTFSQRMIPAGHLREPVRNLVRADTIIVTRTPGSLNCVESESHISNLKSQIEQFHGRRPLAWTRHAWTGLRLHFPLQPGEGPGVRAASERDLVSPDWLCSKRLVTLLGIGNPKSIIDQLEAAGATVVADVPAGDHERFSRAKLEVARGLCDVSGGGGGGGGGSGGLVMTQKDWVRARELIDLKRWPVPIVIPQLEIEFLDGREPLEQLLLTTSQTGRLRPSTRATSDACHC